MDDYTEQQAENIMNMMPDDLAEARLASLPPHKHVTYKFTRLLVILHMMQNHNPDKRTEISFVDIVEGTKCDSMMVGMVVDDLVEEGIFYRNSKSSEPENKDPIEGKIIWVK